MRNLKPANIVCSIFLSGVLAVFVLAYGAAGGEKRWGDMIRLVQPGGKQFVAAVIYKPGTRAQLVTVGADGGRAPTLNEITLPEVDALFGSPFISSDSQHRSYRLMVSPSGEDCFFEIDLVFKNNRVKKYRVRSSDLEKSDKAITKGHSHVSEWVEL